MLHPPDLLTSWSPVRSPVQVEVEPRAPVAYDTNLKIAVAERRRSPERLALHRCERRCC